MNACYGTYVAGLAARMEDEGDEFSRRQEELTDEIYADRAELQSILWDVFATDAVDGLIGATLDWLALPNASACADGTADARARKAINDALAKLVEKAVDERVNEKLRAEGWVV